MCVCVCVCTVYRVPWVYGMNWCWFGNANGKAGFFCNEALLLQMRCNCLLWLYSPSLYFCPLQRSNCSTFYEISLLWFFLCVIFRRFLVHTRKSVCKKWLRSDSHSKEKKNWEMYCFFFVEIVLAEAVYDEIVFNRRNKISFIFNTDGLN